MVQVLQAIICLVLGLILDINNVNQQRAAEITNNIALSIVVIVVTINVIISAFDIKFIENRREIGQLLNTTTPAD